MFNFSKKKEEKCEHKNVKLRSVHPITKQHKRGVCEDCGEWVKAKIVWESDND